MAPCELVTGIEGVRTVPVSWLGGAEDFGSELGGTTGSTEALRSVEPVGALPSGLTDGMTPGSVSAAEPLAPAPDRPPFLAPLLLLDFLLFLGFSFSSGAVVREGRLAGALPLFPMPFPPEGGGRPEGPGPRGSGIASKRDWSLSRRACSQESISCHWLAENPMQRSQGSRLVHVLHAGQMACGSQPFPGRNWEQRAQRALASITDEKEKPRCTKR